MCGIVGYITGSNKLDYEKYFKQALVTDVIRGFDSTGIIVGTPTDVSFIKKAVNAIDFLDMKPVEPMINRAPSGRPVFMIGHNRAATVGKVNSNNAHPFEQGTLTGVHNGTLRRYNRLERDRDFGTDSECLYYNMSRNPVEQVLSDIDGAYTLVWHDSADNTVNIVRNDDRPLWIGKVAEQDTVLYASESGMLRWLASRNGIKLEAVMQPQVNVQLKFHMDAKEVATPEYIELKVVDNYPVVHQPSYNGGYASGGYGGVKKPQGVLPMPKAAAAEELGVNFSDSYEVYCHKFEPYQTTPMYGKAVCYMMDEPYICIELRALSKQVVEGMVGTTFDVKLTDVDMPKDTPWDAVGIARKLQTQTLRKVEDFDYVGPDGALVTKSMMAGYVKDGCHFCNTGISSHEYDHVDFIDGKAICPDCIANNVHEELEA